LSVLIAALPAWAVTAFPGAQGFGANASGGRGGTVYHVTNLNDSGTGSFRDAVSAPNRIVVFDVGGVINISSKLGISGNITIAGQTAPGGIVIYKNATSLTPSSNVIIRYMTFRQGVNGASGDKSLAMMNGANIMLDHLSVMWGRWDTFGITADSGKSASDITFQDCILGEAVNPQNFGGLIDGQRKITLARNLFINNNSRNPKGKADMQYINNVIYNWGSNGYCGGHSGAPWYEDLINNYFIAGPSSTAGNMLAQATANDVVYQSGNFCDNDLVDTGADGKPEGRAVLESDWAPYSGEVPTFTTSAYNVPTVPVATMSAADAFPYVLSGVGNSLIRDSVDIRLVNQTKSMGTQGAIIYSEADVGGQPAMTGGTRPTDSDNDGMPDFFETALGLNPAVADNNGDYDGDGYTNIEHYINWLAGPHARVIGNSSADIALAQYAGGYVTTATYTVSGATHGTVTLLADGRTARFTPTTGYAGLAEFSFTVNDGRTATFKVNVLVEGSSAPIPLQPDPMTWASAPAAAGLTSITMTATTAASSGGVEYYFTCTAGGGHDSGWQTASTYVDSGLVPAATYTYTARARDKTDTSKVTVPSPAMSATTRSIPAIAAPGAYWLFDETSGTTAHDYIGTSDGTLMGTPAPSWTAGQFGNCVTFINTTQSVTVPSNPAIDFSTGSFSVVMWAKQPVSYAGQYELIIKGTIGTTGTFVGSGKRYELYRKDAAFRFAIDDNVVKTELSVATTSICTGNWVHIVAVRDTAADQLKLYVNGAPAGTLADGTGDISQTEAMYVGYAMGTAAAPAAVDDLRIYRYALTADQVAAIYIGAGVPDTAAPTPGTMTWATPPHATGYDSIAMTASTATDLSGVEYYFTCTSGGGHDSGWQNSTDYTDTGLTHNTTYTYTVTARDKSANHNVTSPSAEASATTLHFGCSTSIEVDLNGDCRVDMLDLALFGGAYANGDTSAAANLNGDEVVDFADLAMLIDGWLACNRLPAEECLY
jgi:pectate lyase